MKKQENDAYWLKFYHFAGEVDTAVFNKLQAEQIEELKKLDEKDFHRKQNSYFKL